MPTVHIIRHLESHKPLMARGEDLKDYVIAFHTHAEADAWLVDNRQIEHAETVEFPAIGRMYLNGEFVSLPTAKEATR